MQMTSLSTDTSVLIFLRRFIRWCLRKVANRQTCRQTSGIILGESNYLSRSYSI